MASQPEAHPAAGIWTQTWSRPELRLSVRVSPRTPLLCRPLPGMTGS